MQHFHTVARRLAAGQVESLSNHELLAMVVGQGECGQAEAVVIETLLAEYPHLSQIFTLSQREWSALPGLSYPGYCHLHAVLELVRREAQQAAMQPPAVRSMTAVAEFCQQQLSRYQQEVFACVFLGVSYEWLAFEPLFFGSLRQAQTYPREVVRRALYHNAAAVVCCHNHPSGQLQASVADKAMTEALGEALAWVDCSLIEHYIVSPRGYVAIKGRN